MNLRYLVPRLVRHFTPEAFARFLLQRRWLIRPGLETTDPQAAVERYVRTIEEQGRTIRGKRLMVFGYGGSYAVGVRLLAEGAAHVILCEHYVLPDPKRNRELLADFGDFLASDRGGVRPRTEFLTLLHGDIRQIPTEPVDVVVSTSVFEHLRDVAGTARALARATVQHGLGVHFIDLRDHFFKYPFEMLSFSAGLWNSFLDPTSHLNRYRIKDYRACFEACFARTEIKVLGSDEVALADVRHRILPEFLSGDEVEDAATLIRVVVGEPLAADRARHG